MSFWKQTPQEVETQGVHKFFKSKTFNKSDFITIIGVLRNLCKKKQQQFRCRLLSSSNNSALLCHARVELAVIFQILKSIIYFLKVTRSERVNYYDWKFIDDFQKLINNSLHSMHWIEFKLMCSSLCHNWQWRIACKQKHGRTSQRETTQFYPQEFNLKYVTEKLKPPKS